MGNGVYNHSHFQYQQNLKNLHKTTFLPMLCSRNSIKDVVALPRLQQDPSSSSSFSNNDPLSPKIGCMGQVKRNNKIIGFPHSATTTTTTTNHNHNNYKLLALTTRSRSSISISSINDVNKNFKLKRFFSAKNIITTASAANTNNSSNNSTSCTASSCSSIRRRRRRREANTEREVCCINIAEMDPPLPVIKRDPPQPAGDHLWKRRSNNGGALKSLELQHIEIPRYQIEIQSV